MKRIILSSLIHVEFPADMTEAVALEYSIAKWRFIKRYFNEHHELPPASLTARSCGLCHKFFDYGACNGCPVMKKTGERLCHGSPFEDIDSGGQETAENIDAEIRFLVSLRAPQSKKTEVSHE